MTIDLPADYPPPDCTVHDPCQPCNSATREPWPTGTWWFAVCDCHPEMPTVWKEKNRAEMPGTQTAYVEAVELAQFIETQAAGRTPPIEEL